MVRLCPFCQIVLLGIRRIHLTRSAFHRQARVQRNPYHVLGLKAGCGQEEIKTRFYELSKQFHPDVNNSPSATAKFSEITQAYETIGSPTARRSYDEGRGSNRYAYRGAAKYRYTGPAGGFKAREFSAEDWKRFQEIDRLFRARRRDAEAGSNYTDNLDLESRYRASNYEKDWFESPGSGGTTEFSRRRQEWLKFQDEKLKNRPPKPQMRVYFVITSVVGLLFAWHLYLHGSFDDLSLWSTPQPRMSSWPDEPGATGGSMSLADRFWNSGSPRSGNR